MPHTWKVQKKRNREGQRSRAHQAMDEKDSLQGQVNDKYMHAGTYKSRPKYSTKVRKHNKLSKHSVINQQLNRTVQAIDMQRAVKDSNKQARQNEKSR
jgi:hypothetical protein